MAGEHSTILVRALQPLEGESRAAPVGGLGCDWGGLLLRSKASKA